jgi:hypothetical protein
MAEPEAQLIELVFDELTLFESVNDQYQDLGMHFEGAVAIQPSNPAFRPMSGSFVLMPETIGSPLVVTLEMPVQRVTAIVNGARQVRMTSFDRHSNILAHERTTTCPLHSSSIESFPSQTLQASVAGIARVVFASDAPFLIESLSYS